MLKSSKYKIMEKYLKEIYSFTEHLANKMSILSMKKKYNFINNIEYQETIDSFIMESLPYLEMISHIGYENSIDIAKVPANVILFYLYDEDISFEEVMNNYNESINKYVKNIITFALLDSNFENAEEKKRQYVKIRKNGLKSIYEGIKTTTCVEQLLNKIDSDNFSVNTLSQEEKEMVQNYHNSYMTKNMQLIINDDNYSEDEVARLAKKIIYK